MCHTEDRTYIFSLESVPFTKETSQSDPAKLLYQNATQHNSKDSYVVKLPLKNSFALGDSASRSLKPFYTPENRFSKNRELKAQYNAFIEDYPQRCHRELLKSENVNIQPNYYLPYHAVISNNISTL